MSKLLQLKLNSDFKSLKAQEIDFTSKGEIIEIKGNVGSGKTTLQLAPELAMSGGSKKQFPDPTGQGDFDIEVCLSSKEMLFMRTSSKDGDWNGYCYQKDSTGKISKDPIIDGRKMTPAIARNTFQTELTFGAGRFISADPRVHLDFMMDTYSHKLSELGVIFDKSAPSYNGSILWRLDQSKMIRTEREYNKKALNGFRNHLEAEGYDEENIPALIDVASIEGQIRQLEDDRVMAEQKHNANQWESKQTTLNLIQAKIDKLTATASELMGKILAYNSGLEAQEQLRESNLKYKVDIHNNLVVIKLTTYNDCKSAHETLLEAGYDQECLITFLSDLKNKIEDERDFGDELAALPPLKKVPITDGKVTDFELKYTTEVNQTLTDLHRLRIEISPLIQQKQNPQFETAQFDSKPFDTSELTFKIEQAKATNKINQRWDSFFAHQEADENVKEIWKEYCSMFTKIDLGVSGLTMQIVGDEEKSEIRTFYDARYNPALFGNIEKEPRLLSQYSETQRPIIAILMQNYLLQEKLAKGEDGLRAIFVEMPMDMATRLTLKKIKDEFDIDIFTSTTGDFDRKDLKDGQFVIENGRLLGVV